MSYSYEDYDHAAAEKRISEAKAAFVKDMIKLLKKHKVEMTVRTSSSYGYHTVVDGIDFEFDGIYGTENDRPYFDLSVGAGVSAESLQQEI